MKMTLEENGETKTFDLEPRDFRTGSKGYFLRETIDLSSKSYWVNVIIVDKSTKKK